MGIRFVRTKATTLGSLLSPTPFSTSTNPNRNWLSTTGFSGCGHKICTACKYAENCGSFQSRSNRSTHRIRSLINCNTKFVIYLITCSICNIQYVGCTTNSLKIRICRHLLDINRELALNVSTISRHFQQCHSGDNSYFKF